ncbi:O-antigen ligase family protein [Leptolyngbya sp. 7M]|uniref:O-antigen ligase family protein n=1 Tax=Leptolyngbya sp. 7M TaxID=2812896 RepID=UPI001B8BFA33|nr:O-antigen ligase family protein [Leptolyngbya sp. 7M]QYO66909.1 O-antigen ligase family protein [Leptolyngbya sp. 7M]
MTIWNRAAFVILCAMPILTVLAYGTVHHPMIGLFYILIGLMAALWTADAIRSGAVRFSRDLLQLPFYLAFAYGLFQVIPFGSLDGSAGVDEIPRTISYDPFWTQVSALHFFSLGLFFSLSLVLLDSARRLLRFAMVLMVFGFGFAFFSIIQSVLSPDRIYGIYEALSPFGSFVNRHNFAAAMVMLVSVPMGRLFSGSVEPDKRLLYLTAIALMGASILLSGSRGGLVAFVAMAIFLVFLTARGSGRKKLLLRAAMVILLFVAVVFGAIFVGGDTSLTRIADTSVSKDITTGRFDIWDVTLKMIAADLPFGAGLGAYGVAYTRFDQGSGLERVEQAHNDYLQVASDAGIPGVIIGLAFLYFIFIAGRRAVAAENLLRRGLGIGALAGVFAMLVHSLFDFVLHTTGVSVVFVSLLTLLVASGSEYADDVLPVGQQGRHRERKTSGRISQFRRENRSMPVRR